MEQDRPPEQADRVDVSASDPVSDPVSDREPEPSQGSPEGADSTVASASSHRLAKAIAIYTVIRVGLMAVLTVALMWVMPLIVALAFAVVLQLPLSFLVFPGARRELTGALAETRGRHHAERDRLRAELMGDGAPDR